MLSHFVSCAVKLYYLAIEEVILTSVSHMFGLARKRLYGLYVQCGRNKNERDSNKTTEKKKPYLVIVIYIVEDEIILLKLCR